MDLGLSLILFISIGALAVSFATRYVFFRSLQDDNPIEEICEEVIKSQTGVDIDITPSTPEKVARTKPKVKRTRTKKISEK